MKKYSYLFLIFMTCLSACRRKSDSSLSPTTGEVLVKSIYYDGDHDFNIFKYDSAGRLTDYSYAFGKSQNSVDTSGMIHLQYLYTNNNVTKVKLISNTFNDAIEGNEMHFAYNGSNKINKIDYYDWKGINNLSDSILYNNTGKLSKIISITSPDQYFRSYTYYQDENLKSILFGNESGIYDSVWFENYNTAIINPSANLDHLQNYARNKLLTYHSDSLSDFSNQPSISDRLPYNLSKNVWSSYGINTPTQPAPTKQFAVTVTEWYYQYPKTILTSNNNNSYYFEYIAKPK